MPDQPFDWSAYLRLAHKLAARSDEACLRSSLSRAYYFVYNLALQRAKQNGFVILKGEPTHQQLWVLFSRSPEPECIYLSQIALRLKERREKADYESVYRRIEEEVPYSLQQAQEFAARLEKLPSRHPNPQSQRK